MTTFDDLSACETTDPVRLAARDRAAALLLASPIVQNLDGLRVAIVDFERAPAAVRSAYFTDNCMAVVRDHGVVVNDAFLRDAEIAIRAFGIAGSVYATPFLRSESDMFALVRRMRERPREYLDALRTLTARPERERYRREQLALALVFFLGHEIGHLRERDDRRAFTTVLPEDAPLEARLAVATAKYCRHVDELHSFGFDLTDFDWALTKTGEVRAAANAVMASLPPNQAVNHDAWFAAESRADDCGADVLVQTLNAAELWRDAPSPGPNLAIDALFAVSLVAWYRDLLTLLERLEPGGEEFNIGTLIARMMRDRQSYVRASSVFGAQHRYALLRATLTMGRVLRECPQADDASVHDESVRRWTLLRRLMDTAVKLATMGATTAWMLRKDEERGSPQLFMMEYWPLARELAAMQRSEV